MAVPVYKKQKTAGSQENQQNQGGDPLPDRQLKHPNSSLTQKLIPEFAKLNCVPSLSDKFNQK
jgi:hypothetical protein